MRKMGASCFDHGADSDQGTADLSWYRHENLDLNPATPCTEEQRSKIVQQIVHDDDNLKFGQNLVMDALIRIGWIRFLQRKPTLAPKISLAFPLAATKVLMLF